MHVLVYTIKGGITKTFIRKKKYVEQNEVKELTCMNMNF